jgi:hypothetical protein
VSGERQFDALIGIRRWTVLLQMSSCSMTSAFLSLVIVASTMSCTKEYCDCPAGGVWVRVAPSVVPDVASVGVSGPGCASGKASCISGDATACTTYFIAGSGAGTCRIEVAFKSHAPTFVQEKTIEYQGGGCCGGFYPKDATAVQVTAAR